MKRKNLESTLIAAGLIGVSLSGLGLSNSLKAIDRQPEEVRIIKFLEQNCSGDYAAEMHHILISDCNLREEYKKTNAHEKLLFAYPIVSIISLSVAFYGLDVRQRRITGLG